MSSRKRADALLTTSEVARILRVHTNTARRWGNRGVLPSCRIGPRRDRRFRRKDIQALLSGLKASEPQPDSHEAR